MIRAQRVQGIVFIICALTVVAATVMLPRLDSSPELIAVATVILLLGVPHGALDPLFMRRLPGAHTVAGWAVFGLVYVLLALGVVALWVAAPAVFLAAFLLISAAHFSGDPGPKTGGLSRVFYGGAIIVVPALLHSAAMETLFAALAGHPAAASIMPALRAMAGPWLLLLMLCAAIEAMRDPLTGMEIAALGVLASVAPPLVAFATFFCAMHSPRHILRTAVYAFDVSKRMQWATGLAPMLLIVALVAAAWLQFGDMPVDGRLIRITFVGLAALTVPHMMLVERVRLAGWSDADAGPFPSRRPTRSTG